jgi:adenylate cyclase
MPFLTIDSDEGNALGLGFGVASEIINELARNKDLRLIARDSSFALATQTLMAQELGEQLGTRYLVEGTAQRVDGTLLVDVQLVDARDGSIAWGDRFTAKAERVPQFQRAIAAKIAGSLRSGLLETEKHAILAAPPRDLDIYELILRGIARKHQFHPDALRAGRADLEEALRRDLLFRAFETKLRNGESKGGVGFLEGRPRGGKLLERLAAHARVLRALPGEDECGFFHG